MKGIDEIRKRFHDSCVERFMTTYSFLKGRRVYVYGSGQYGQFLAKALVDYGCVNKGDVIAFINDFENGFVVDGIPVVGLDACKFAPDSCVVVAIRHNKPVVKRLRDAGIPFFSDSDVGLGAMILPLYGWQSTGAIVGVSQRLEHFRELRLPESEISAFYGDDESIAVLKNRFEFYKTGRRELLEECPDGGEQYFAEGLLGIGDDEVFLDLGAYTGDTVLSFVNCVGGKYRKIVAFEPDHKTFEGLARNTSKLHDVELVEAATGGKSCEVSFSDGHGASSCISGTRDGGNVVKMVKLDDFITGPVTLVKMDIEGAELDTLHGMEGLLKEFRPKLAVCVYHKVEDLYTIPKYLKQTVPEYRFKLRQHEPGICETVLYAEAR